MQDTIAAIATPPGEGGLHVLRLSGPQSYRIADKIFSGKLKQKVADLPVQHTTFGTVHHPESGRTLDEVLLTRFAAPQSYTAEDIVEISCHGGLLVAERIFDALLKAGARPAAPGEFTRRAFTNGKLDLCQAEAVADLIHAASDQALDLALAHLRGQLSERLEGLYQRLLSILSQLETAIDFPEEGLEFKHKEKLKQEIDSVAADIRKLIDSYRQGKIIREGLKVVLVGKPNVGKSSLLNALLNEDRAIVTQHPGTTRDVLEERLRLRDRHITLLDTAGLRQGAGEVEEEGMRRTRLSLERADLVLIVLDSSQPLDEEDRRLMQEVESKTRLWVMNKADLPARVNPQTDLPEESARNLVSVSATQGQGLEELLDTLYQATRLGTSPDILITRQRHKTALENTHEALVSTSRSLSEDRSEDLIAVDLHTALMHLGGLLGHEFVDDLLTQIFDDFCIGK